jgi:uncharacterized delta-60 repeat protein
MKRPHILALGAAFFLAAAGCSAILGLDETTQRVDPPSADASSDQATPAEGGADAVVPVDAGGPRFSTAPASPRVVRGSSAPVRVDLARDGFEGGVSVTFTELPNGVTSTTGVIAADAGSTTLTIEAGANVPMGTKQIKVQGAGVPDLSVPLLVAGPPGSLDDSFNSSGILNDAVHGNGGTFFAVIVQADGRIVAGGARMRDGTGGWAVRRYNPDGTADTAFNNAAAAVMPNAGGLRGLALDPNTGKIVCVGTGSSQAHVIRLNTNGSPDAAFANSGVYIYDQIRFGNGSEAYAALVRGDSSIVVAGSGANGSPQQASIETITNTGQRSGSGPTFRASFASSFLAIAEVGGRIVAAGIDSAASPPRTFVHKLGDNGFADAGTLLFNDGCEARSMTAQPSGQYVFGGTNVFGPSFCMASASATGVPAWSFTMQAGNFFTYSGLTSLADNRLYAVGFGGSTNANFALIERRNADGGLDRTFTDAGAVRFGDFANVPPQFVYQMHAIAQQADGRVIIAGNKNNAGYTLIRVWP